VALISCLFLCSPRANAQREKADTVVLKSSSHSPKKAAIMSALLPGLGQAYNKKYWKMPIIYAGFGGLGYVFVFNQKRFVMYRDAFKYRVDADAGTVDEYVGVYTDNDLVTLKNYYHRYRDVAVIGGLVLYMLNIVDAAVDAHLFTFDVSDNLSMNIAPYIDVNSFANNIQKGVSLKLNF